jgi:hypothetical protein
MNELNIRNTVISINQEPVLAINCWRRDRQLWCYLFWSRPSNAFFYTAELRHPKNRLKSKGDPSVDAADRLRITAEWNNPDNRLTETIKESNS